MATCTCTVVRNHVKPIGLALRGDCPIHAHLTARLGGSQPDDLDAASIAARLPPVPVCAQCRGTGWRPVTEGDFQPQREIPGVKEPCGSCDAGRAVADEFKGFGAAPRLEAAACAVADAWVLVPLIGAGSMPDGLGPEIDSLCTALDRLEIQTRESPLRKVRP